MGLGMRPPGLGVSDCGSGNETTSGLGMSDYGSGNEVLTSLLLTLSG